MLCYYVCRRNIFSHGSGCRLCAALLSVLLILGGCAQYGKPGRSEADKPGETGQQKLQTLSLPGFTRIDTAGDGVLFVNEKHAGIGGYDAITYTDSGFRYADEQARLSAHEQTQLQQLLAELLDQMSYNLEEMYAPAPGACVLQGELYLQDLRLNRTERTGSQVNFFSSLGSMVVVLHFRDSITRQTAFIYMEPETLGRGVTKASGADFTRLQNLLEQRLTYINMRYRPYLDFGDYRSRQQQGCEGRIGKVAGIDR